MRHRDFRVGIADHLYDRHQKGKHAAESWMRQAP